MGGDEKANFPLEPSTKVASRVEVSSRACPRMNADESGIGLTLAGRSIGSRSQQTDFPGSSGLADLEDRVFCEDFSEPSSWQQQHGPSGLSGLSSVLDGVKPLCGSVPQHSPIPMVQHQLGGKTSMKPAARARDRARKMLMLALFGGGKAESSESHTGTVLADERGCRPTCAIMSWILRKVCSGRGTRRPQRSTAIYQPSQSRSRSRIPRLICRLPWKRFQQMWLS